MNPFKAVLETSGCMLYWFSQPHSTIELVCTLEVAKQIAFELDSAELPHCQALQDESLQEFWKLVMEPIQ